MKNLIFIRDFNPAYDIFLLRFFKEGGLIKDEEPDFGKSRELWFSLQDKLEKAPSSASPYEKAFDSYMNWWRVHPECRPAFMQILQKVHPIERPDGSLDLQLVSLLDNQARKKRYKIVFDIPDIAEDFQKFYQRYVKTPLEELLEKGVTGKELSRYFTMEELDELPDIRVVDLDAVEAAGTMIAKRIIERLGSATVREMILDIAKILNQDFERAKAAESDLIVTGEFAELRSYYNRETQHHTLTLVPVRGATALEEYYEDTIFPKYRIYEVTKPP